MKKITLLLMLSVSISMMYAQNGTMYLYTQGLSTDIPVTACSSNGQYFIGTFNGSCMFYNYKTGAVIQNVYDVTSIFYEFKAVSDSGVVVGAKGTSLDDMQPISFKDDSATLLSTANLPSFYYGTANGISADGTTIVGYIDYGGNIYKPVIWNNGTPSVLPYPTTDVFGEESNGAIAEHVSANGNMIVGRYYTSNYDEIGIKWVYNTQTSSYTATLFSSDINFDTSYPTTSSSYVTGNYIDFTTGKMSSNGQYLISTFVSRVDISTTHRFPILFDLNTNDTTMYVEYNDALGMSVSNSGLVTTAMPFLPTPHRNSYIYIPNDNTSGIEIDYYLEVIYSFTDWPTSILASTGTASVNSLGDVFFGYARDISTDNIVNYYIASTPAVAISETTNDVKMELFATLITDNQLCILENVKHVKIYDCSGKLVLQDNNNNKINLSGLTSGMYLVTITNDNNETSTQRVIKK